jgi:hypothetical protein
MVAILLAFSLTLPACTCKGTTTTEEPPSPPEKSSGALSFEPTEYTNAEYGFSVKYPKEWQQKPTEEPTTVLYAAAEARVPALSIFVIGGNTFAETLVAALSKAGGDIKIVTERGATLTDGTPASEAVVKWKVQGFGADSFALGVKKGDKWVIVAITTVSLLHKYDEAKFSEIAHTLQFK